MDEKNALELARKLSDEALKCLEGNCFCCPLRESEQLAEDVNDLAMWVIERHGADRLRVRPVKIEKIHI